MLPFRSRKSKSPVEDDVIIEKVRVELASEEFPEGPYGAATPSPSIGKSTPWRDNQSAANPYDYENKQLHEDLERVYPGDKDA